MGKNGNRLEKIGGFTDEPEEGEAGSLKRRTFLKNLSGYFIVALLGLTIDFGALMFCTEVLRLHYLVSATLGFILGLLVNFFLSERFVFKNPSVPKSFVRFGIYASIGLAGVGLLGLLMWAQVALMQIPYLAAKVFATGIIFLFNFLVRRAMYLS